MIIPKTGLDVYPCSHKIQVAVRDPFKVPQNPGKVLDILNLATNRENFKTMVMVKVYVHTCQCNVQVMMLEVDDLLVELTLMMIVDQADHTDYRAVPLFPSLLLEPPPNQVTDCFGTVCVTETVKERIEVYQQPFLECNAKSYTVFFLFVCLFHGLRM